MTSIPMATRCTAWLSSEPWEHGALSLEAGLPELPFHLLIARASMVERRVILGFLRGWERTACALLLSRIMWESLRSEADGHALSWSRMPGNATFQGRCRRRKYLLLVLLWDEVSGTQQTQRRPDRRLDEGLGKL